jgi:hypothetical protein
VHTLLPLLTHISPCPCERVHTLCGEDTAPHFCRCAGCSYPQGATLELKAHNQKALRLYERHGFAEVGRRPKFYACGADALLMARQQHQPEQGQRQQQGES